MFRSVVFLATFICAIHCSSATAQGRNRRGAGPSLFGFGIGIGNYSPSPRGYPSPGAFDPYGFDGNAYDPYQGGSFRAPDLLDDPYFRERHRFDSRFPGRYRTPKVVGRPVPATRYRSQRVPSPYTNHEPTPSVPVNAADLVGQLRSASQQLSHSLSKSQNGDGWMEYLRPHEIDRLVASGESAKLRELLTHYDGVVGNPKLKSIMATSGFAATRSLLRQYVSQVAQ
jgi:hypothetical protein